MTIPASHVDNALKIEADGFVHLFKVMLLPSGVVGITSGQGITWQGVEYESLQCKLSGLGSHATEQVSRPRFDVQNPEGAFSGLIAQGALEGSRLYRYRVLRADAEANNNVFQVQWWRIVRVARLNRETVSLELRESGDGPNFVLPANISPPPDVPTVSLR